MQQQHFFRIDDEENEEMLSNVIGCTPIRLEDDHLAELRSLIANLPEDAKNLSSDEKNLERFEKLINLYSGEPQFLDPVLPSFISTLLPFIDFPSDSVTNGLSRLTSAALLRLRVLSVVRGHKLLMRFLPHEFELLEPILFCLEYFAKLLLEVKKAKNSPNSGVDKRLIHILVVWLLIICKNPFNLNRMMTAISRSGSQQQFLPSSRIVMCMDIFLREMIVVGELAVVPTLMAQIITRNTDNREELESRFKEFKGILLAFESEVNGGQMLISQLQLLNQLLKQGRRSELKSFVLELIHSLPPHLLSTDCPNILVRNLMAKFIQRIALVLLEPRLVSWRYRCGFRSLEDNLRGRKDGKRGGDENNSIENEKEIAEKQNESSSQEEEYDKVEKLLEKLLPQICDKDNMVRWTAAKGVASICARIPLRMAQNAVSSVINICFGNSTIDEANAWHGGCLALAELCRRGCLFPERVLWVIREILPRALTFEQSHTGYMQAVNVRDAASYICWAFARAYEPAVLRPHLTPLAGILLSTALFDREVNVRRAASAAFQENVGRNDSFPHGIAILSLVDYAEVARTKHCYTELAVQVAAQFPEYVCPLLDHLCSFKSRHWDERIRELTANALQRLALFNSSYVFEKVLPEFCKRVHSSNPHEKYGALLSISALVIALHGKHNVLIHRDLLLTTIFEHSDKLNIHRTKGYFLICNSLCRLIEALCCIGCELSDQQLGQFHDILDILVADNNKQIVANAMSAFPALMSYYEGKRSNLLVGRIRDKYFVKIRTPCSNESLRCSCIIPLGHIPTNFLSLRFCPTESEPAEILANSIIQLLVEVIQDSRTPKWVFARVAAIQTLSVLLVKYRPDSLCWTPLIDCLACASDDYTTTVNGDIGRFARVAAIDALAQLLPLAYSSTHQPPLSRFQLDNAIGKIVTRACESIDDLRAKASIALGKLAALNDEHPLINSISELNLLRSIFLISPESVSSISNGISHNSSTTLSIEWRHSQGFVRLSPLLASPSYGQAALLGFVLSAGSVCSWTSQNAFLAIVSHLRPHKNNVQFLEHFLSALLSVHSTIIARQGDPSPVFVLFRMLLNDQQLRCLEDQPDDLPQFRQICELLAVNKGKIKVKALAVSVLGSLLQLNGRSQMYRKVLNLLISLLASPYGSLRELAAEQLFESLSLLDSSSEGEGIDEGEGNEKIVKVLEELSQVDWSGKQVDDESLVKARRNIAKLLCPPINGK